MHVNRARRTEGIFAGQHSYRCIQELHNVWLQRDVQSFRELAPEGIKLTGRFIACEECVISPPLKKNKERKPLLQMGTHDETNIFLK